MGIALGLLGLLLLLSFDNVGACKMANSDVRVIKLQTQKALDTDSYEMARYHAFKALTSLENTKSFLEDCGCEPASVTAKDAGENLKRATKSESLEASKGFLKLALQNTLVAINALNDFDYKKESRYADDVLVLNTLEVEKKTKGPVINPAYQLEQKLEQSLAKFESSLKAVVQNVACRDAVSYINKTVITSDYFLRKNTLTEGQREYHAQVKFIAQNALLKLEGCQ